MRALPGGRLGWQRHRAWIEVFSSAEMTNSPTFQFLALEAALAEVQDYGGLGREVRVTRKDPRAVEPRADRVLAE
ncbi:MAG: hypothetical protein ACREKR_14990 [Candidatus Methylomirabilales bacterium]